MKARDELVDSAKLLTRIVKMGLSSREAAEKSRIGYRTMQRLLHSDCGVMRITGERLRQAFGADVTYRK